MISENSDSVDGEEDSKFFNNGSGDDVHRRCRSSRGSGEGGSANSPNANSGEGGSACCRLRLHHGARGPTPVRVAAHVEENDCIMVLEDQQKRRMSTTCQAGLSTVSVAVRRERCCMEEMRTV